MKRYSPAEIEPKWQKIWDEQQVYKADLNSDKPKYIAMSMFNYPSGILHIGHALNYTISDVRARFKRQQGYESYHPVGWDAFGLPAENRAIKAGVSPQESMAELIPQYHHMYRTMGWSNDWSKEISTHLPVYYKWTQWIFAQMYRNDLAYQDARQQWWCTQCQTVLANEQVIDGKCWRHDGADDPFVEKREVKQWFFKITDYANELLEATEDLDWTESVKLAQKNWIGKSVGAEVDFKLQELDSQDSLKFTPQLSELIKAGSKTSTIRNEKKDLDVGDIAAFHTRNGDSVTEFGYAKITNIRNSKLKDIPNDLSGYEPFLDDQDKLTAYRSYYGDEISLDSEMYIYDFEYLCDSVLTVFTTRPDTLYGATFIVLAPEHELVEQIVTDEQRDEVSEYVKQATKKSERERQESKEKTGVFTGAYATNPVNGEKLPVWVADYVLVGYGTGAIMAVPAHDERDNEFAKKFDLPIVQVVAPELLDQENPPRKGEEDTERNVVMCLVEHPTEDKILTVKWRSFDWHNLVMGGVEGEESIVEAGMREVREETGYTEIEYVSTLPVVMNSKFYAKHKAVNRDMMTTVVKYKLKSLDQVETKKEAHEDFDTVWIDADNLSSLHPVSELEYILEWLKNDSVMFSGDGVLINSGSFDRVSSAEARELIVQHLKREGKAREKTTYKLRDWSVSRQRYWGAPVPIVHCQKDGIVLVPDDQLPIELPELEDFAPSGDGRSALARATDWLNTTCPECGGPAQRETDTLDTYICSSWYMLRYFDPTNEDTIFDSNVVNKWMPIDFYNGADHATAHMIYARFVTRFFYKQGLVENPEPFKKFLFNGKVTAADGSMFSKRLGNGVDPLEIINQGYGADALRTYLMFAAPLELWIRWDPKGVPATHRFLSRLWNLVQEFGASNDTSSSDELDVALKRVIHPTIQKVTDDIEQLKYNTAIAAMMKCVNDLYELKAKHGYAQRETWQFALESMSALVAPFAPHIADELWQQLGHDTSVQRDSWPQWDDAYLVGDTITLALQVNGKVRAELEVAPDASKEDLEALALANERVQTFLEGKSPKRVIVVPGRLINIVV